MTAADVSSHEDSIPKIMSISIKSRKYCPHKREISLRANVITLQKYEKFHLCPDSIWTILLDSWGFIFRASFSISTPVNFRIFPLVMLLAPLLRRHPKQFSEGAGKIVWIGESAVVSYGGD